MSQKSDIRKYLESGKGLTRLQAARIVELEQAGMKIIKMPIKVNTRYGKKRVVRYLKAA